MKHDLSKIVTQFQIEGELIEVAPYGTGHIHDTYASRYVTDAGEVRYIHQRMNHNIFQNIEGLMSNVVRVTDHIRKKVIERGGDPMRESLNLVLTKQGDSFYKDEEGNSWRTYVFIEGAKTYDLVENPKHVINAAKAIGRFQEMVSDLPEPRLVETIPQFGDSSFRFEQFTEALEADVKGRAALAKPEIDFLIERKKMTSVLMDLLREKKIPERIAHYDTKFNNVMLDDETDEGICVIDLDTTMPGTVLYDFGDAVRVATSTAVEDEPDLSKVSMDIEKFDLLATGYLSSAREFLTATEVKHLAFAGKLITMTIGIRFLADFLAGDVYFKTHMDNHNLIRCRTQFKMVADMEKKYDQMCKIIEKNSDVSVVEMV